jgi:hypothetical protein
MSLLLLLLLLLTRMMRMMGLAAVKAVVVPTDGLAPARHHLVKLALLVLGAGPDVGLLLVVIRLLERISTSRSSVSCKNVCI